MDYKIVSAASAELLEMAVYVLIDDGWDLLGGVSVDGLGKDRYNQAMVYRKTEED